MAKLQKRNKGAVPTIAEASNNLGTAKEVIKPMSFKMPMSFYKELKKFAYEHDMSFTDIFKQSFYLYRDTMKK